MTLTTASTTKLTTTTQKKVLDHCKSCRPGYKALFLADGRRQCFKNIGVKPQSRAAHFCKQTGDKLPLPTSEWENDALIEFVKSNFKRSDGKLFYGMFPLDLTDKSDNNWVTSEGKTPGYTKWAGGMPKSNTHGQKRQAILFGNKMWHYYAGNFLRNTICQQICPSLSSGYYSRLSFLKQT